MPSTGTGSRDQNTVTSSKTNPWEPTIGPLKDIIGQINGQMGNTAITGQEQTALDQLMGNAQGAGQYTSQVQGVAGDVLGQNRTGIAQDAYDQYKTQSQPYLSADYLNPYTNPAFSNYLNTTTNDIQNRVNGMFAGAGRDMSGANLQTLARGITEGTAPIFANQYNQNVSTQRGVMDNLYNAGSATAGLLSNLDQSRLQTGVQAGQAALDAQNSGPMAILQAAAAQRGLPLQNIGAVSGLLTPLAGLGGQSRGAASSQMTYEQPLAQTVGQWMNAAQQLPGAMNGIGGGIRTLGNWFSPVG